MVATLVEAKAALDAARKRLGGQFPRQEARGEMEKYAEDSKMDPDPEHADDWLGKAQTEVAGRAD